MRDSVRDYLGAVFRHGWWFGVTVLLGAVGVANVFLGDVRVPSWVPWAAAFVTLNVAQFRAFHDIRAQRTGILFPNLSVELMPLVIEDHPGDEWEPDPYRYLVFNIRVVNREPSRKAILEFEMNEVLLLAEGTQPFRRRFFRVYPLLLEKRNLDRLLVIEPETPIEGLLLFEWDPSIRSITLKEEAGSLTYEPTANERLVLTITDSISDKSKDFPVSTQWGRKRAG